MAAPASAGFTATGPIDPASGFPAWYQDSDGLQLELCIQDAHCPASPTTSDFTAPAGEAFYQLASATATGSGGQAVTLEYKTEGAFLNPGDGQQITFGRVQATLNGLVPNAEYTITHPYGVDTWTAGPNGDLVGGARAAQRIQIGCAGTPCDFNAALGSRIGPFLRWDPAVAPAPPSGYVGDGVSEHAVVGSPTGTNFIRVNGPGLPDPVVDPLSGAVTDPGGITTDQWIVEGKIASAPAPVFFSAAGGGVFGTQRVGTTTTRTVSIKNNGLADMTLGSAAVTGADFAKGADTCSGATLVSGATCTVDVRFTPTADVAPSSGALAIDQGGAARSVALSGTGGQPGVGTAPAVLDFFNQNVSTTSPEHVMTLTNTGPVSLTVSGMTIAGPNASEFGISSNPCLRTIAPGASCAVGLKFLPAAGGARNATLSISSDAPGGARIVPLTGNGTTAPTTIPTTGGPARGLAALPAATTSAAAKPAPAATALRIGGLSAARTIRLASARRGVRIAMTLPSGTTALKYALTRGTKTVQTRTVSRKAGASVLKLAVTRKGTYRLRLTPVGRGSATSRTITFKVV